jgi:putative spermidine/putrescine transport system ATP-binding protein
MVSTTQNLTARTGSAAGPGDTPPYRGGTLGEQSVSAEARKAGGAAAGRSEDSAGSARGGDETFVEFIDVEKVYGDFQAVKRLHLTIGRGEFLTFLGPSGSGKTTTLNMLAGFERPSRGMITLAGKSVDRLPPYERNIGMVFQNYALFPHMSVEQNVAFPLSVRKTPKADIAPRVRRALEMVRLEQFKDRKPAQLSGGQ